MDIAQRVKVNLEARGYAVVQTRLDEGYIAQRTRLDIAIAKGAAIFVSIHLNSNINPKVVRLTRENPTPIMGGGRKVFFFMRGPMARLTEAGVNQQPARVAPRPAVPGAKGPSIWDRLVRYAREVWAELKRVDWPSRPELVASTIVVVAVLAVLSAYLGAWDALFTWLFTQVLGH